MRGYGVMVVGTSRQAEPVVAALRHRGLIVWTECLEGLLSDSASPVRADCIVLIDDSTRLRVATDPILRHLEAPRVLLTAVPLDADERAWLLDRHEFDFVLAWPAAVSLVVAVVERCMDRRALPRRYFLNA